MCNYKECDGCKRIIGGTPRTSFGMGNYCHVCIPNCKTCGKPVNIVKTTKCNLCWEVEHRIEAYLESPRARTKVRHILDNYL